MYTETAESLQEIWILSPQDATKCSYKQKGYFSGEPHTESIGNLMIKKWSQDAIGNY